MVEYQRMVGRGQIRADPHQVKAVELLQQLYNDVTTDDNMR